MRAEARAPGPLQPEDVQALFLELAPEPRFAVGDVHAFDDLAARGAEPAAKLHALVPCSVTVNDRASSCL